MPTPLSALSDILSSGIATIESIYAKNGTTFPSLDEPFQAGFLDHDQKLSDTIDHVIAAASQLIALVKPAQSTVMDGALSYFLSASIGVAVSANIPEILREAGPQGLHIKDIGEKCGSDPNKIGRVLRYLATNHIFREISTDTFASNRISSVIDTGKSVATLKADPTHKHDNTSGFTALIEVCTDETMKAGVYLADNLLDPKTATSQEPLDCPFSRAFGRVSPFEFLEQSGNAHRLHRFGIAMHGASSADGYGTILTGFDWKSVTQDALVVDIGGGLGSSTLQLFKAYPHLRYVVQDRPNVISDAAKFWGNEDPEALKSGRVELQAHDFFQPQPVKDASVFFLRHIIHDWPDTYARKILKRLRASAGPSTKLILCDYLVPYAAASNDEFADIQGSEVPPAPYPLLPNLGAVANFPMCLDLQMMTVNNGQERSIQQFISLVNGTGWKLDSIGRAQQGHGSLLIFNVVAVPCACKHHH